VVSTSTKTTSLPTNEEKATVADSGTPLLPLVYLYLGILFRYWLCYPSVIWWISGTRPALVYLGQGEELATMTDACRILTPGMVHLDQLDADGLAEAVGMPDVPACLQALDSSRTFPLIFSLYIRYNGAILEPLPRQITFQLIQTF
jgi:hypothetical protein